MRRVQLVSVLMQIVNFDTTLEFQVSVLDFFVILWILTLHLKYAVHIALIDKAKNCISDPSESRYNDSDRVLIAHIKPARV